MSDLNMVSDTFEEISTVESQDGNFEGRPFPSEKEILELYTSELNLGTPFSPLSVIYYTDKDERDIKAEGSSDLRGALQEQGQIITLLRKESVDESRFENAVAVVKSPSGWKEIAYMLKDMKFGEKTLKYLEGRFGRQTEETPSIEETMKLLRSNLKQQALYGRHKD